MVAMVSRIVLRLGMACLGLAMAGCLGGSQNPSYFPFYLPTGDIIRTHGKPGGIGYFKNFDPKAAKIEVTPAMVVAPTKTQQVFIATVYDTDGQPRRKRRVEWIIDGPGSIVEVDESGYLPGRGYKVDNKYAVSYTDYFKHCITRGNDDPRDDFTVMPGQSWCVVSSPVEGETTVTAYAPEVFDWNAGRAFAKVTWADTDFRFPPPTSVHYGSEADLATTILRTSEGGNSTPYRVRYRIIGGTPAVLVGQPGTSGTYSPNAQEAETLADSEGLAGVRITQRTPQAGSTRLAVEIIKPTVDGVGPGSVIGRHETTVEWSAPQVTLDVKLPSALALDRETPVRLALANSGTVDSQELTIRAVVPEGTELVQANPPPTQRDGRSLVWAVAGLPGGGKRDVELLLRPTRRGTIELVAGAETADGLRAEQRAQATVDTAGLRIAMEAPSMSSMGSTATVRVQATNTGAVPIRSAIAWITPGEGLRHESGKNPVEVAIGAIEPGATQSIEVPLVCETSGSHSVRVNVTADGAFAERADATINVSRAELKLQAIGPDIIYVNDEAVYELRVTNDGDAPVSNVKVTMNLPRGVQARSATEGGEVSGTGIRWAIDSLNVNETKIVRASLSGEQPLERGTIASRASTEGKEQGAGIQTEASTLIAVAGKPILQMILQDVGASVREGDQPQYRIIVRNRGTGSAKDIVVEFSASGGITPTRGLGPADGEARIANGAVVFPTVADLPPGSDAVFVVNASATGTGDARLSARVKARGLSNPLQEDQATQIQKR